MVPPELNKEKSSSEQKKQEVKQNGGEEKNELDIRQLVPRRVIIPSCSSWFH